MQSLPAEEDYFIARIKDLFTICRRRKIPKFSYFLNEKERMLASSVAKAEGYSRYQFFGGYPDAIRVVLGVFPEYMEAGEEAFPVKAVTCTYRKEDVLTHRDFLGALMSLQIKRETIGDILTEPGKAVIFLADSIIKTVFDEVHKIGRVGVTLISGIEGELPAITRFTDVTGTVASMRLDSVVSLATGLSREKSGVLIKSGKVFLNYTEASNLSAKVQAEDCISIRGHGKFLVLEQARITKKGRLHVHLKKYL